MSSRNPDSECVDDLHMLSVPNCSKCVINHFNTPVNTFQLLDNELQRKQRFTRN